MEHNGMEGRGCEHGHDWPALRILKVVGMVIGGLFIAVVFGFLFGYFVMKLWNWLMPDIFGLKTIGYWQAFGIVVLAKMLFGGSHGSHYKHHGDKWRRRPWRHMHGGEWAPGGDYSNWKYYEDYWKSEGKAAYEAYLERIKGNK
ncbi:MAG: hypothetical protein ABSA34_04075 [Candidatus Goldiibacteriota bacterium]|jgi:hypothetical protein